MYKLTREEKETTINWSKGEKTASVYSADPVVIRKLDKLAEAYPDIYQMDRINTAYKKERSCHIPVKYIRFGKPKSKAQLKALEKARVLARKPPVAQE